jgi:hypothetical protein
MYRERNREVARERIARKAIERIKKRHDLEVKRISKRADISLLQNEIYAESLAYDLSRDLIMRHT